MIQHVNEDLSHCPLPAEFLCLQAHVAFPRHGFLHEFGERMRLSRNPIRDFP
jgi:hypothetical protein